MLRLLRDLANALSVAMNFSIIGAMSLAGSGGRLGVSDETAMNGCGKLDGELNRFVVLDRAELELRHRLAS
jgi:hypothetical protein